MAPRDPDDEAAGGPDDPDTVAFREPLPPEDRIWRHPSELARGRRQPPAVAETRRAAPRVAALMALSGMVGATLAVGIVALLGGFEDRVVERRVAVSPTSMARRADSPAVLAEATSASVAAVAVDDADPVSAVVVRSDGHLVTALASLGEDPSHVDVHLSDASVERAVVVAGDPVTGLALLHVDRDDLIPAAMGTSHGLAVGDDVLTVAAAPGQGWNPVGTGAMVAGVGLSMRHGNEHWYDLVMLDGVHAAAVIGGAVTDTTGAVVGLVVGIGETGAAAVPAEVATTVVDDLLHHGHARHAWLGVQGRDGDADTGAGAVVEALIDGGPAWAGGLAPGDVIVAVDDRPVASMSDLIAALRRRRPGDAVALALVRGGEPVEVDCELGERPTES